MNQVLVYGLAAAGEAVCRALQARSIPFVVADDLPGDVARQLCTSWGVDLIEAPTANEIDALVSRSDLVIPAPGVPETHHVFASAHRHDTELCSEIELAYRWEQQRTGGPRPMLAITGTDGKTTTTELTAAIVHQAGRRAAAVGNTETPLISAIDDDDIDVFVVEASSFRLATTREFRAQASAWLNLAADHQNWHTSLEAYAAAKAKLWQSVRPDDVAVGAAHDPVVRRYLDLAPCRRRTVAHTDADYVVADGWLMGPQGRIAEIQNMARSLPHDLSNALTAAALTLETSLATRDDIEITLAQFRPPRHRIEFVAESAGIRWFDDSKATTPHAALTAVAGFDSVVWIVGGRNKGLDLSALKRGADRVRVVIALGEAGPVIADVFDGVRPVHLAPTMAEAVQIASDTAHAGDVVLLSPACASYDAYLNYAERGDDFARRVRNSVGGHP